MTTAPAPPVGIRPQTLMLTFLGNAVLGRDIAVFSGSFIAVMERLNVAEQATRSTLTRMVDRGLLARHRQGRKMYFGLTPHAAEVLTEGEQRVWRAGAVNGDERQRWTLLGFSLPESRRDDRHQIRSRLRWAGFGMLRSGLWIAPGTPDLATVLPDRRLLDDVLAFRAEPAEPTDIDQLVRQAYDLEAIASGYHEFVRRWDRARPLPSAPDDLARLLWLLSEWFLLLRDDPRIPLRHLPAAWPAVAAEKLFHRQHTRLVKSARRITDTVLDSVPLA